MLNRAQGCLLGQIAGDSLGSLVEFKSAEQILELYPHGVRELQAGGTWDTLPGQPTDDSEMALGLARTVVREGTYDLAAVGASYIAWLDSAPFDCGRTVRVGLSGKPDETSQANGALMRISPLGIFGAQRDRASLLDWARQDAMLTHPHRICVQANLLFVDALATAIAEGTGPHDLYAYICERAKQLAVDERLLQATQAAATAPPEDFLSHMGWVLIAWQNALWHLQFAPNFEEGIIDTVMRGGDTDTNAAICGALLGAVHGQSAVPKQWQQAISNCKAKAGKKNVMQPRPRQYWPTDALELAESLLRVS